MSTASRPEGDSSSPLQSTAQTSKILTHSTIFVTSKNASSVIAPTHALAHQVFSNHRYHTSPQVTSNTGSDTKPSTALKKEHSKKSSIGNLVYPTQMSRSKPC